MIDQKTAPYAALILRVTMGLMFLAHAYLKVFVFGMAGAGKFFASIGLPAWFLYPILALEIIGGLALIAGIAGATQGDSSTTRTAGQVAIIGGGYLLKSGLDKRNQAQIHVQALEELGQSLEAEITPQVIELEDRTITLNGNVEDQYAQWRELLADIYQAEVGAMAPPADITAATDKL